MDERRPASTRVEPIPLVEEEVRVGKREVTTGRVRVRTETETLSELARATLDEDRVEVSRVVIGREVESVPEVRTENGVLIVPVLEEVLVVQKRLVLKEELHIRRTVASEDVEVPITLRKQRAFVERLGAEDQGTDGED
jgi:uncharacterized protein (TIGR02271 family)